MNYFFLNELYKDIYAHILSHWLVTCQMNSSALTQILQKLVNLNGVCHLQLSVRLQRLLLIQTLL